MRGLSWVYVHLHYIIVSLRKFDLNPFWTKNNNEKTSSFVVVNKSFRADNVILGATQSNCKLPCTTHSYTTKEIMKIVKKEQDKPLNWIDLIPSDKIEVIDTRTVIKTFTEYLAELVRNTMGILLFSIS